MTVYVHQVSYSPYQLARLTFIKLDIKKIHLLNTFLQLVLS